VVAPTSHPAQFVHYQCMSAYEHPLHTMIDEAPHSFCTLKKLLCGARHSLLGPRTDHVPSLDAFPGQSRW
jgi:hypothetical protein